MVATLCSSPALLAARPVARLAARRASAAPALPSRRTVAVARVSKLIRASAAEEKRSELQLPAAAVTLAAALSSAGAAEAAVSPSLKNLLLSVLAGGSVLAVIAVAIIAISSFDKVVRKG